MSNNPAIEYFSKGMKAFFDKMPAEAGKYLKKAITMEIEQQYSLHCTDADNLVGYYQFGYAPYDADKIVDNFLEMAKCDYDASHYSDCDEDFDEIIKKWGECNLKFFVYAMPAVYELRSGMVAFLVGYVYDQELDRNDNTSWEQALIFYQKYMEYTAREDLDSMALGCVVKAFSQECTDTDGEEIPVNILRKYGTIAIEEFQDEMAAYCVGYTYYNDWYTAEDACVDMALYYYILYIKFGLKHKHIELFMCEKMAHICLKCMDNPFMAACFAKVGKIRQNSDSTEYSEELDSLYEAALNKLSDEQKGMIELVTTFDDADRIFASEEVNQYSVGKASVENVRVNRYFDELDQLIGLSTLKKDVRELVNFIDVQNRREKEGHKRISKTMHLVFSGNPGTGKTTVARILGNLYKEIGALSKGHVVEVSRADLVAEYIGHTAQKTQAKIDEALGGILFIDEAYTLAGGGEKDFGKEAIETILIALENHRKDFVVIVAGYSEEMHKFIDSNAGLSSRFNRYIDFPDYSADELIQIFEKLCRNSDYTLSDSAKVSMERCIRKLEANKGKNFANARDVRNLFENVITKQASRIAANRDSELIEIVDSDFENL